MSYCCEIELTPLSGYIYPDQGHGKILIYIDQYKSIFLGQIIGKSIFLQFFMQCNYTISGKIKSIIWAGQYEFGQPKMSAGFGDVDNQLTKFLLASRT